MTTKREQATMSGGLLIREANKLQQFTRGIDHDLN